MAADGQLQGDKQVAIQKKGYDHTVVPGEISEIVRQTRKGSTMRSSGKGTLDICWLPPRNGPHNTPLRSEDEQMLFSSSI